MDERLIAFSVLSLWPLMAAVSFAYEAFRMAFVFTIYFSSIPLPEA